MLSRDMLGLARWQSLTSRDQPSPVLMATTRPGDEFEQVADQRSAVGVGLIRFAPEAAKPVAEVIEDEIDISA